MWEPRLEDLAGLLKAVPYPARWRGRSRPVGFAILTQQCVLLDALQRLSPGFEQFRCEGSALAKGTAILTARFELGYKQPEGAFMKRQDGRWPAFADARGIDAKYAQVRREAERELADTEAGPRDGSSIPPGDTEMKNPHGEFQHPSPMTRKTAHPAGPCSPGNMEEAAEPRGKRGVPDSGR